MAKRADIPITAPMMQSLPSVYDWVKIAESMSAAMTKLQVDINHSERMGAASAARGFLALYAAKQRLDAQYKAFTGLFDELKETRFPDILEVEGVTNVPLDEGYRVQTGETMYVSIVPDKRDEAMEFLRKHEIKSKDGGSLSDIIIETVNASTLSAAARFMLSEMSQDLPSELFQVTFTRTTSVVKTQTKR